MRALGFSERSAATPNGEKRVGVFKEQRFYLPTTPTIETTTIVSLDADPHLGQPLTPAVKLLMTASSGNSVAALPR